MSSPSIRGGRTPTQARKRAQPTRTRRCIDWLTRYPRAAAPVGGLVGAKAAGERLCRKRRANEHSPRAAGRSRCTGSARTNRRRKRLSGRRRSGRSGDGSRRAVRHVCGSIRRALEVTSHFIPNGIRRTERTRPVCVARRATGLQIGETRSHRPGTQCTAFSFGSVTTHRPTIGPPASLRARAFRRGDR